MFGKVVYSHPECHGHFGALAIPAVDWFTQYAEDSKKGEKKKKGSNFYYIFLINLQLLGNMHLLLTTSKLPTVQKISLIY